MIHEKHDTYHRYEGANYEGTFNFEVSLRKRHGYFCTVSRANVVIFGQSPNVLLLSVRAGRHVTRDSLSFETLNSPSFPCLPNFFPSFSYPFGASRVCIEIDNLRETKFHPRRYSRREEN